MTYKSLLEQAKHCFHNPGDAEYLIQVLSNIKRHEIFTDRSQVSQEVVARFNRCLRELKPDMPVQYLLHKAYFLSYEIYIDQRVMIPRPETEELVMKTVSMLNNQSIKPNTILDIGGGSGAIAVALADIFPKAVIDATDISSGALEVAKINIKNHTLESRISLYQTDLFPIYKTKYDLIISNPPYIPRDEIKNLPRSVKNYEPHISLNGGKYGFEIIEKIIRQAPAYLSQNGLLALEIDPRQEMLIKDLTPNAQFEKDNQGFTRYAFISHEA